MGQRHPEVKEPMGYAAGFESFPSCASGDVATASPVGVQENRFVIALGIVCSARNFDSLRGAFCFRIRR
jgi:hypothetical protein